MARFERHLYSAEDASLTFDDAPPRAPGRDAAPARRPRRRWRFSPLTIATIFGAALGLTLMAAPDLRAVIAAGYERVSGAILAQPAFVIRRVEIDGAAHLSDAEILGALGLDQGPMRSLDFDVKDARRALERLGWVRRATVRTTPPQLVEVVIEERVPAARWRRDGRLALLDADGALIADDLDVDAGVLRGATLREVVEAPLLVGPGAENAVAEAIRLDETARAAGFDVIGLVRVGQRRWDLELFNGPRIMLPEADPAAALTVFASWSARTDLLNHGFAVVDFRDPLAPVGRWPLERAAARLGAETPAL